MLTGFFSFYGRRRSVRPAEDQWPVGIEPSAASACEETEEAEEAETQHFAPVSLSASVVFHVMASKSIGVFVYFSSSFSIPNDPF